MSGLVIRSEELTFRVEDVFPVTLPVSLGTMPCGYRLAEQPITTRRQIGDSNND